MVPLHRRQACQRCGDGGLGVVVVDELAGEVEKLATWAGGQDVTLAFVAALQHLPPRQRSACSSADAEVPRHVNRPVTATSFINEAASMTVVSSRKDRLGSIASEFQR